MNTLNEQIAEDQEIEEKIIYCATIVDDAELLNTPDERTGELLLVLELGTKLQVVEDNPGIFYKVANSFGYSGYVKKENVKILKDPWDANKSILVSVKKLLGITEDYEQFDQDIIMHINSALMILSQIGVKTEKPFFITSKEDLWSDFVPDDGTMEMLKTYVFMKVKLMFDPPLGGTMIDVFNRQISELEWRINAMTDYKIPKNEEKTEEDPENQEKEAEESEKLKEDNENQEIIDTPTEPEIPNRDISSDGKENQNEISANT